MSRPRLFRLSKSLALALCGVGMLLFPAPIGGQVIARQALTTFPADTQQMAYVNLAQIRGLPEYPQIRRRLVSRQLLNLEDFLRSMDADPEKDVDEVVLGWRGEATEASRYFGLAQGRFQPGRVRNFFTKSQLPFRDYEGVELYPFGSGEDPSDIFLAFLDSSTAAFGRQQDVKALLDARAGTRPALDSNATFVNWEAELEGSAPQWGVASGKTAVNQAMPWLSTGGTLPVEPSAFLGPVQAVLYRVDWSSGFTTHLSILCQSSESAAALTQVLTMWQSASRQTAANLPSGVSTLLQQMDIQSSGSRVELSGSGPVEALGQFFQGPTSSQTP